MHPEDWNPSLKKSRHKKSDVNKTAQHKKNSAVDTEASSIANSPQVPSSRELNHTEEAASHENEHPEIIESTHVTSEKITSDSEQQTNTYEYPFTLSKSSSFDTLVTTKRIKRRNKKWLFIPLGLLISLISGVITFSLLVQSERGKFISQKYNYQESELLSDNVSSVFGKIYALAEKEQNSDHSDEEFSTDMMQDDERLQGSEDVEDYNAIVAADDTPLKDKTFEDSVDMAKFETQDETAIAPSEKDPAFEESQPDAISNPNRDIVAEPELTARSTLAYEDNAYESDKKNTVETPDVNPFSPSEKSPQEVKREPSRGLAVKIFHAREEGHKTVDTKDEMSVQERLSNTGHLITGSNIVNDTDAGIHKPLNDITGKNSQGKMETLSSGSTFPDEQTDIADTEEKMLFEQTSFNDRESVQIEGEEQTIQTLFANPRPSDSNTNVSIPQSGTSSTVKEMFVNYEEQFNDNSGHWPVFNNSMASVLIDDGKYHVEHKASTGSYTVLHPDDLPNDMDFMIHVFIRSVQSSGEYSYGFVFGAKDAGNSYSFQIRNNHLYSIEKMLGGHTVKLAQGSIDNIFISQNSQKTLKIVRQGNIVRFYIDDHYIDEIVHVDFPGNRVGFLVEGKVKTSIEGTKTQIRLKK
jgi:hypothetical protein